MCCDTVVFAQVINTGSRLGDIALVIALLCVPILIAIGLLLLLLRLWRARLGLRSYLGIRDYFRQLKVYLRKFPQTKKEELEAVELTLKGAVLFVLGWFFFPLLVISLVPLYYGLRKLAAIRLKLREDEEGRPGV